MNSLKAFGFAALVALLSIQAAQAVNVVPLKPDGANAAPCTVYGSPNNGMSCGKTTAPATVLDLVGDATFGNRIILSRTQIGTGTGNLGIYVSTVIPVTSTFQSLISSASTAVMLESTPNISTTTTVGGATELTSGTILVLSSTSSISGVTFQDAGTLTGSQLQLGAASRTVSQYKTLVLIYDAVDHMWREIAYGSN